MSPIRFLLPALLALGWALPAAALDESDLLPIDQAFALSAEATGPDTVELHWQIADGYYLYRHRFGVEAKSAGFGPVTLDLPEGTHKTDPFFGEVQTYRDHVTGTVHGQSLPGATVQLAVRYQGCADAGICYPPHTQTISVALAGTPTASAAPLSPAPTFSPLTGNRPLLTPSEPGPMVDAQPLPPEQAFTAEAIALAPDRLLIRLTPADGYYLYRDRTRFALLGDPPVTLGAPDWPPATPHVDEHFGDVAVYFQQIEVPLPLHRHAAGPVTLELEATLQGCQTDGICYPPMPRRLSVALPALPDGQAPEPRIATAEPKAGEAGVTTPTSNGTAALLAVLGAVLGGLVLNLMPCVLPVLSLKALSLADSGHSHAQARHSALWYTAGVLVSFAALGGLAIALRAAGQALGWGFQLQQPWLVALLGYVMFAVGLSLSGLFQVGLGLAGVGQTLTEKRGAAGDFFTGVLAVVVASPCTAPFMGPALAVAFAGSAPLALAVFLALGLGLALPFLLIGFVPALATRLPKPGAWMVAFKQVLAFPMYLTAAWLGWVLTRQRGADAIGLWLIGCVLLAAALWGFERQRWRPRAWAIALCLLLASGAIATLPLIAGVERPTGTTASAHDGSVPYAPERLASLRAEGRVVFVNMTADWCVTCKANEARVFATDAFAQAMRAHDAVYMVGDWTDVDPAITAFLDAHHAVGVPLYVVYGPGSGADGEVLPTVLTLDALTAAFDRAATR